MIPARIFAIAALAATAPAAAQLPDLKYEAVDTLSFGEKRFGRYGLLLMGKGGRLVAATEAFNNGELIAFDTARKIVPGWGIPVGYRAKADIGWFNKWGWIGDSIWIADNGYDQIAILSGQGKLSKSLERPNWIRPSWGDRHRYPIFSGADYEAAYPDGSLLVVPRGPRAIFDTPRFDKTGQYLMRTEADGRIIRQIAVLPRTGFYENQLRLRDVTLRKSFDIPYNAKSVWKVSADGRRIVIVQPLLTARDSGAFRVTMLDENGDTVWVRRFQSEATRVPQADVESRLGRIQDFGRYSATWIRDSIRKMVPVFESRVANVAVGADHSVWVWVRSTQPEVLGLVIDPAGNALGWVRLPVGSKIMAFSADDIWIAKSDRARFTMNSVLVRHRRAPTPVRRTASRAR